MEKLERFQFLPSSSHPRADGGRRKQQFNPFSRSDLPKVTVITAVYNGEEFLENTIQSIVNQTYPNLEFIVVDGGSTDGTIEILKRYSGQIDYWISEKDRGISDAFNKGVLLSSGDYLNFQGDGDGFVSPAALEKVMNGIDAQTDMLVSARVNRVALDGSLLFTSVQKPFHRHSLLFRMSLPHQGLLTHVRLFEQHGLFDVKNRFCMDYEHLLRAYHHFPSVVQKNEVLANWRADGLGNGKTDQILTEYDRIKKLHQVAPTWALMLIRNWSTFKYRIKQALGKDS